MLRLQVRKPPLHTLRMQVSARRAKTERLLFEARFLDGLIKPGWEHIKPLSREGLIYFGADEKTGLQKNERDSFAGGSSFCGAFVEFSLFCYERVGAWWHIWCDIRCFGGGCFFGLSAPATEALALCCGGSFFRIVRRPGLWGLYHLFFTGTELAFSLSKAHLILADALDSFYLKLPACRLPSYHPFRHTRWVGATLANAHIIRC